MQYMFYIMTLPGVYMSMIMSVKQFSDTRCDNKGDIMVSQWLSRHFHNDMQSLFRPSVYTVTSRRSIKQWKHRIIEEKQTSNRLIIFTMRCGTIVSHFPGTETHISTNVIKISKLVEFFYLPPLTCHQHHPTTGPRKSGLLCHSGYGLSPY